MLESAILCSQNVRISTFLTSSQNVTKIADQAIFVTNSNVQQFVSIEFFLCYGITDPVLFRNKKNSVLVDRNLCHTFSELGILGKLM